MLKQVISGGQTGADQAGLIAAEKCGIDTGGVMPKGFKTLNGSNPELAKRFGLAEHSSSSYVPRTRSNVRDADATLRIASNFNSPGEKCTLKYINIFDKPHLDIPIDNPQDPQEVAKWLQEHEVAVLNIAGNSEKSSPGIAVFAVDYLTKVFELLS